MTIDKQIEVDHFSCSRKPQTANVSVVTTLGNLILLYSVFTHKASGLPTGLGSALKLLQAPLLLHFGSLAFWSGQLCFETFCLLLILSKILTLCVAEKKFANSKLGHHSHTTTNFVVSRPLFPPYKHILVWFSFFFFFFFFFFWLAPMACVSSWARDQTCAAVTACATAAATPDP